MSIVFCVCVCVYSTLQLHLPVRSAQAHACLSRSQVWLSEPATLHSHCVHCVGEEERRPRQAAVITSATGPGKQLAECVPSTPRPAFCFSKPLNHNRLTPTSVKRHHSVLWSCFHSSFGEFLKTQQDCCFFLNSAATLVMKSCFQTLSLYLEASQWSDWKIFTLIA